MADSDSTERGAEIIRSLAGGSSPSSSYKQDKLREFSGRQIEKVQEEVEEKTGDPEAYIVKKIVLGQELAKIASSALELEVEDSPTQKVADVPVGMTPDGSGVYCQVLVSRKPRILILHYEYQGEHSTGSGSVEAEVPVFGDEEAEIEHFLTNMD
jgi:hypothetical protein